MTKSRLHTKVNLILSRLVGRGGQINFFAKESGMSLIKRLNSNGLRIQPWRQYSVLHMEKAVFFYFWPIFMEHVEFEYELFIKLKLDAYRRLLGLLLMI